MKGKLSWHGDFMYTKYEFLSYVLFGKKHSYNDFGMVLKSVSVALPEKKTIKYTNNFLDGDFDVLEGMGGLKTRKIRLKFGIPDVYTDREKAEARKRIIEGINNRTFSLDDPDYPAIYISQYFAFYEGTAKVNPFQTNWKEMEVVIDVDAQPYGYATAYEYKFSSATSAISPNDPNLVQYSAGMTGTSGTVGEFKKSCSVGAPLFVRSSVAGYTKVNFCENNARTELVANEWKYIGNVKTIPSGTAILHEYAPMQSGEKAEYRIIAGGRRTEAC